jgi:hypothetical protein
MILPCNYSLTLITVSNVSLLYVHGLIVVFLLNTIFSLFKKLVEETFRWTISELTARE